MQIKQFTGASIDEILPQIREELGEDALVITTRRVVKGGIGGFFGKESYEVTAAQAPTDEEMGEANADAAGAATGGGAPDAGADGSPFARHLRGKLDAAMEAEASLDIESVETTDTGAYRRPAAVPRPFAAGDAQRTEAIIEAARQALADAHRQAAAAAAPPAPPAAPAAPAIPAIPAIETLPDGRTLSAPQWSSVPAGSAPIAPRIRPAVPIEPPVAAIGLDPAEEIASSIPFVPVAPARAAAPAPVAPPAPAAMPAPLLPEVDLTLSAWTPPELSAPVAAISPIAAPAEIALPAAVAMPAPAPVADAPAAAAPYLLTDQAVSPYAPAPVEAPSAGGLPRIPALHEARAELLAAGVEECHLDPMLQAFARTALPFADPAEDLRDVLRGWLAAQLPAARVSAAPRPGHTVVLVGQTGVGKTTTACKLAGRMSAAGLDVALVAAGPGSHPVLEAHARALGLDPVYARDGHELAAARQRLARRDLIVVDTAGCSRADEIEDLAALVGPCAPDEVHLVLPAAASLADLPDTLRRFRGVGVDRITMTKLDETRFRGNLVNVPVRAGKPLAYLAEGAGVPGAMTPADGARMARTLLP